MKRERRVALVAAALIVLLRSAVFVFWEQAHFDSDQAVIGLMAKHLTERRALPVFTYGQQYILGVEAWLAAPVFLLAGPTVQALKFPLLLINVVVAVLLIVLLERHLKLRPLWALTASLFFILPPPGTATKLIEAIGGNLEPFLYVLLLWMTRHRPVLFGAIFAFGFLHRPFTLYGLSAILLLEATDRSLFRRERLRDLFVAVGSGALMTWAVQFVNRFSSAAGPGTSLSDLLGPPDSLAEIGRRTCLSLAEIPAGLSRLATVHWPLLFGTVPMPMNTYGILSERSQGEPVLSLVLVGLLATTVIGITRGSLSASRREGGDPRFALYLILVGLQSAGAYALGRCGQLTIFTLRYDLLSLLIPVGLVAWHLAHERRRWWTLATILLVTLWAVGSAIGHVRLIDEYTPRPPRNPHRVIGNALLARNIRYALSDFWIAYHVTFLTGERVIVAAQDVPRILTYDRIVTAHPDETAIVSRTPCGAKAEEIFPGVFLCRPEPGARVQ